jgi:glycosyltransferase involved in cell wall biosynthesis
VNQYLNKSGVFVLPMRQGAGIKIKALEAMALGVPLVSTPQGMEGIEINDECLISDTDQGFAEQVIRLSQDMSLRQAMAGKARTLIADRYDCRKNVAGLVEVYLRSLAEKRHALN